MKYLEIRSENLLLYVVALSKPEILMGRSPHCEVVLRASQIQPVHFLLEWAGEGLFEPDKGFWTLFDISTRQREKDKDEPLTGNILSDKAFKFGKFTFRIREQGIEETPLLRKPIMETLTVAETKPQESMVSETSKGQVLETAVVLKSTQSTVEVVHTKVGGRFTKKPIKRFCDLKVKFQEKEGGSVVDLILKELPGAKIFRRGIEVEENERVQLHPFEVVRVQWESFQLYIRLVPEILVPVVKRSTEEDRIFWKTLLFFFLPFLFLLGIALLVLPHIEEEKEIEKKLPRVATLKVIRELKKEKLSEIEESAAGQQDAAAQDTPQKAVKKKQPDQPSASRQAKRRQTNPPPKQPQQVQEEAPNQGGVLALLSKRGKRKTLQAESAETKNTSRSNNSARQLKDAKLSSQNNNNQGVKSLSKNLNQSRFQSSNSGSRFSRTAGKGKFGAPGATGRLNQGSLSFGSPSKTDEIVEGGLSMEDVRRVIDAHRGQILSCYERGLLRNPKIKGRITYNWRIYANGSVGPVKVHNSEIPLKSVQSCIIRVIRSMKFPKAKNGQDTRVRYPFQFTNRK